MLWIREPYVSLILEYLSPLDLIRLSGVCASLRNRAKTELNKVVRIPQIPRDANLTLTQFHICRELTDPRIFKHTIEILDVIEITNYIGSLYPVTYNGIQISGVSDSRDLPPWRDLMAYIRYHTQDVYRNWESWIRDLLERCYKPLSLMYIKPISERETKRLKYLYSMAIWNPRKFHELLSPYIGTFKGTYLMFPMQPGMQYYYAIWTGFHPINQLRIGELISEMCPRYRKYFIEALNKVFFK